MRFGVRLAIDFGSTRVGIAKCDREGILATPLMVEPYSDDVTVAATIASLASEYDCLEIILGNPINLAGDEAQAAQRVREFAQVLVQTTDIDVRLVDERLTTAAARKQLQEAGYSTRTDKHLIDAAAAVILLEDALESERRQGRPAGELLT
ncbi:MAG: Holliday junction resolvase RuvX [Actinomycetota bacterium]|jgi:putative Holliday junction resolvase